MEYENNDDMDYESDGTIPANWFDTDYKNRVSITINTNQITNTHIDYPFLFNSTVTDLVGNVQADGGDIRFVLQNKTELKSEIQFIDSGIGELIAWTKVPSLASGTTFFMYYNNSSASLPTDPENVWTSYNVVHHMQDAVTTSILDSTNNSSYIQGSASSVTGKIGNGLDFTGSNGVETDSTVTGAQGWLSVWTNPDDLISDQYMMEYMQNRFALLVGYQDNNFNFFMYADLSDITATEFSASSGVWQKIDVVATTGTPNNVKIYKNGIKIHDVEDDGIRSSSTGLIIGAALLTSPTFLNPFNGQLDELEFRNINGTFPVPANIDDRILGRYNNENNPSAFYTIGTPQSIP